jgi:hypothetical protein
VTLTKWEVAPEIANKTSLRHNRHSQAQPDQLLPTSSVAMKPNDRPIRATPGKRKPKGTKNGPNAGKNG